MAAVTIYSDFGAPPDKVSHCFHCFPIYLPWSDGTRCHEVMGLDAMILVFWMLSFKPTFPPFSLSSKGSLVIDISPGNLDSSLCFIQPDIFMMCSSYKLNKQGDSIQTWHTPFPIWNQSVVPCPVLTVASWPAYQFLRRQVRWSGIPRSPGKILFKNFPHFVLIHTIRDFGIVNKAEVDVFLELFLLFLMIQQMLAIWPLVPLPFLNPAWTSGSSFFTYCWSLAWRILSITLLVCEMSAIVQ